MLNLRLTSQLGRLQLDTFSLAHYFVLKIIIHALNTAIPTI